MRNPLDLSTLGRFGKGGTALDAGLPLPDPASLVQKTNLEALAAELRRQLAWPLREVVGAEGRFEAASDPVRREHIISWPRPGGIDQPSYLAYLHELVHARMVESVHPLFGAPQFAAASDGPLCEEALPALAAAVDWFVEFELYRLCPDRMGAELGRQYRIAVSQWEAPGGLDSPQALAMALVLAKGRTFLRRSLHLSGPMAGLVESFQRTPPHKASIFTLRALTNRLLGQRHGAAAQVVAAPFGPAWLLRRLPT